MSLLAGVTLELLRPKNLPAMAVGNSDREMFGSTPGRLGNADIPMMSHSSLNVRPFFDLPVKNGFRKSLRAMLLGSFANIGYGWRKGLQLDDCLSNAGMEAPTFTRSYGALALRVMLVGSSIIAWLRPWFFGGMFGSSVVLQWDVRFFGGSSVAIRWMFGEVRTKARSTPDPPPIPPDPH